MTFRFDRFVLNGDTRQLLADGVEVHLSPKGFTLLLTLIESRARAVSKVELQNLLWPATFIGETNLSTLVAEVRRALGETAQEAKYLRTVHRFGYRFVASVSEVSGPSASGHQEVRMFVRTEQREFPLAEGPNTIGRSTDADIQIDAGGVSRHHARIVVVGALAQLEDLGSKNGTFVRGERIDSARRLADGDEIRVGPVTLTLRIAPAAEATETMA